mgnify:CR=1 FL=1
MCTCRGASELWRELLSRAARESPGSLNLPMRRKFRAAEAMRMLDARVAPKLGAFFRESGLFTFVRWGSFMCNPPLCITEEQLLARVEGKVIAAPKRSAHLP